MEHTPGGLAKQEVHISFQWKSFYHKGLGILCYISFQIKASTLPRRSSEWQLAPTTWELPASLVSLFPLAENVHQSWGKHNKPRNKDHQRSKSLQDIKETFFWVPKSRLLQAAGFSCEDGTARLISGQQHFSVSYKGLVDLNRRLSSPAPGAAVSPAFPLWSFLICQNTFLLHLCSQFNVYSILSLYAELVFCLFFCFVCLFPPFALLDSLGDRQSVLFSPN